MTIPSFTNDALFKIVFGSAQDLRPLISLLNAVLGLVGDDQIVELALATPFLDRSDPEEKSCILDLSAIDGKDRRFNVEVQVRGQKHFVKRITFYAAKFHGQQLGTGHSYQELKTTYSVSFCNFNVWDRQPGDVHSRFSFYDQRNQRELKGLIELHIFELPKLDKQSYDTLEAMWLHLLKFGSSYATEADLPAQLAKEEAIVMALRARNVALADQLQKALILSREKYDRDQISIEMDRVEELEEAIAKAQLEGKLEGRQESARRMSALGFSALDIQKVTGLSPAEYE